MMFRKRLQLAFIHVAVAMTLVPINSTLNRVMIKEMAISATLVALLASLPYFFSPTQMVIGSYSDRHPLFGWRRTPYILIGLLLCVAGVIVAPYAVFILPENWWLGLLLCVLAFGAWGMGFNIGSVSYLSLASELSGESGRSRTISVMWFMMIVGIIVTAAALSRMLLDYSHETLLQAFQYVGLAALVLGILGLIGLEPRSTNRVTSSEQVIERHSWKSLVKSVLAVPQARKFFIYMVVLLAAILGQDVLLEPFAGSAFGMTVSQTTRITSIWGTCVLISIVIAGALERRVSKRSVAIFSAWVTLVSFLIIAASGLTHNTSIFYTGVVLLGTGTGLATVSNLSLMLDMTTTRVGLFIGAWGMAEAFARMTGSIMSGAVRDIVSTLTASTMGGYVTVFFIEAAMLFVAWLLLRRIDVQAFRSQAQHLSLQERAALMNESS
jgi:MFS transporter, BCD family, chlorophyll transporter